jgi:hypothetical protein
MKHQIPTCCLICLLIIYHSVFGQATREISLRFKTDSSSKAVLLSNLMPEANGNASPYIGTAYWSDSNILRECRSLLSFDLGSLVWLIKPEQVTRATLFLQPVQPGAVNQYHTNKFIVRRVTEPWEDSMTTWNNQPNYSRQDEVIKKVSADNSDQTVKVNVTEMLRNMIREGNNGFMLCFPPRDEVAATASKWFGSGKNEKAAFRPVLQIDFYVRKASSPGFPTSPLIEVVERNQREVRPETTPSKETGKKAEPAVNQ